MDLKPAQAKRICRTCPVQTECLSWAVDNDIEYGIWGGSTRGERVLIRRNNRRKDGAA